MTDKCVDIKWKWSFMRIVKGLGPVYLPTLVIVAELTAWALLIRHGIASPDWMAWRQTLLLCLVAIALTTGVFFGKKDFDAYFGAAFGLYPWLIFMLIALCVAFVQQSFEIISMGLFFIVLCLSVLLQIIVPILKAFFP